MKGQDTIDNLTSEVWEFCTERDWDRFHTPTQLAIGITTEASELLDIFRFKDDQQARDMLSDPKKREMIGEELADVLFFVLRFADRNGFDLSDCLRDKLEKNRKKYPVEKFKGKNLKYNEV